jgi:hypothetical protein
VLFKSGTVLASLHFVFTRLRWEHLSPWSGYQRKPWLGDGKVHGRYPQKKKTLKRG